MSGHLSLRLSNFSKNLENEVLVDFFDTEYLNMLYNAYYDSTKCSLPCDNV